MEGMVALFVGCGLLVLLYRMRKNQGFKSIFFLDRRNSKNKVSVITVDGGKHWFQTNFIPSEVGKTPRGIEPEVAASIEFVRRIAVGRRGGTAIIFTESDSIRTDLLQKAGFTVEPLARR